MLVPATITDRIYNRARLDISFYTFSFFKDPGVFYFTLFHPGCSNLFNLTDSPGRRADLTVKPILTYIRM